MRKSFRARVLSGKEENEQHVELDYGAVDCIYTLESSSSPRHRAYQDSLAPSLMNQIGSNAAKLLRRGVTQARLNKSFRSLGSADKYSRANNDAIQSTHGSFKMISSKGAQHETASIYADLEQVVATRSKSDAEHEVDMRIRRSKRRILPSAQYSAPNRELACEGLDLNELEAIKRDNLRLTLRSMKAGCSRSTTQLEEPTVGSLVSTCDDKDQSPLNETNSSESLRDLDAIVCSCKHFEGRELDESGSRGGQYYCSCASLSSFSCGEEVDMNRVEEEGSDEPSGDSVPSSLMQAICDDRNSDDDSHEVFVKLLTKGRKAMSQPQLSFLYKDEHTGQLIPTTGSHELNAEDKVRRDGMNLRFRLEDSVAYFKQQKQEQHKERQHFNISDPRESSLMTHNICESKPGGDLGNLDDKKIIESKEGRQKLSERNGRHTYVREEEPMAEGRLTSKDTHTSKLTLNVRELERLCGDLARSCRSDVNELNVLSHASSSREPGEDDQERRRSCDVGKNDDYQNKKCSTDDDCDKQQQQQDRTQKKELRSADSNEKISVQVRAVKNQEEQEAAPAAHAAESVHHSRNLEMNNVSVARSAHQQVGGALRGIDMQKKQQEQQVAASRLESALLLQANEEQSAGATGDVVSARSAQKESIKRGYAKEAADQSASAMPKSETTSCNKSLNDQDLHCSSSDHQEKQQQQEGRLLSTLGDLYETRAGNCRTNDSIKKQAHPSATSNPDYLPRDSGNNNKESGRRKRQQQRREEIMLSLSGRPDLWHELVAEGRFTERSIDAKVEAAERAAQQASRVDTIALSDNAGENIYSSLYEGLTNQSNYSSVDVCDSHDSAGRYAQVDNMQDLREKERHLFEVQLNHLRMMQDGCADCSYEILQHDHASYQGNSMGCEPQNLTKQQQQKPPKKSLFGKLKHLLAPTLKSERGDTFTSAGWLTSAKNVSVDDTLAAHQQKHDIQQGLQRASRRDEFMSSSHIADIKVKGNKSRALSSMSTQNLFNSSMRYLSASRKSMNLSTSKEGSAAMACEDDSSAEMNGFFSRKSFISGFLTLGRRSGSATAAATAAAAASRAATAKGGKKMPKSKEQDYESLRELFRNNNQQRQRHTLNSVRRIYGSFDSLPSADSGLSCCHFQNSSDENNYSPITLAQPASKHHGNIYSCTPVADTNHKQRHHIYGADDDADDRDDVSEQRECDPLSYSDDCGSLPAHAMTVVGKARAKVDCNPCAYDKEALVFKKGDIIDILERHQSGTWIGRCGAQVGHFKFINVIEIQDESLEATGREVARGIEPATSTSSPEPSKGEPLFVTKVEIKNDFLKSPRDSTSVDEPRRRSLSHSRAGDADSLQPGAPANCQRDLAHSNETLMASLEQLLVSIGLDNCRQGNCDNSKKSDRSSSCERLTSVADDDQDEQRWDLSYLEILNRSGINSLDSFSSIERSSDLERIGIIDEEHKQRLLMAARIIRQALRAAKLDCNESHSNHARANLPVAKRVNVSSYVESSQVTQAPSPSPPPPPSLRLTDRKGDKKHANQDQCERESSDCAHNQASDLRANGQPKRTGTILETMQNARANAQEDNREPIYVNLSNANKISGQRSADGCAEGESSARATEGGACNKSITKQSKTDCQQHLTGFGTNFLFNDLSRETDELENRNRSRAAADYRYLDHNGCMAITNQRYQAQRSEQQSSGASQRDGPHLREREGIATLTIKKGARKIDSGGTSRGGVNNFDSINQAPDRYQIEDKPARHQYALTIDENNNQCEGDHNEADDDLLSNARRVGQERPTPADNELLDSESMIRASLRPPFTRGCSVRVSSRKPKRTSSRLTSRDSKRSSQDCSRVHHTSSRNLRQQLQCSLTPAHSSTRPLAKYTSSSSTMNRYQPVRGRKEHELLITQHPIDKAVSVYSTIGPETSHYETRTNAPIRESKQGGQQNQNGHHASYHLLNPQSQIMNSKSAYDLRVNFSKFLET